MKTDKIFQKINHIKQLDINQKTILRQKLLELNEIPILSKYNDEIISIISIKYKNKMLYNFFNNWKS